MYFDDFSGELMNETKLSQLWMYLHFPLHLFQVAFGIALTEIITSHNDGIDTAAAFQETLQKCASAAAGHGTTDTTTDHAAAASSATNSSIVESAHYTVLSLATESASAEGSGHDNSCDDPLFSIKIFWITAGLILCFNAFIKLINTPVNKGKRRSSILHSVLTQDLRMYRQLEILCHLYLSHFKCCSVLCSFNHHICKYEWLGDGFDHDGMSFIPM